MTANQIAYLNYIQSGIRDAETKRHNLASLEEQKRSNLRKEWLSSQELAETGRHNKSIEDETFRSNTAKERETNRSNIAKERETHRSNVAKEKETNRANLAKEGETARHNKSAEEISRTGNTIDQWKAEAALWQAQTGQQRKDEDIRHNRVSEQLGFAQNASAYTNAQANLLSANTRASELAARLPGLEAESEEAQADAKFAKQLAAGKLLGQGGNVAKTFADILRIVMSITKDD